MFRKPLVLKDENVFGPNIVYEESRMDIKPYIDYKVEEYRTEYAALYSDRELSNLVNFTINWKNKAGFDNVKKIRITRKIGNTSIETITINKYNNDGTTEDTNNTGYFKSFETSTLSVKFEGVPSNFADSSNIFGENVFNIEYSTDDINFSSVTGINAASMKKSISREEVLLAVETTRFVSVQFNPKIEQSGEIVKQFKNDTGYYFYPKQTGALQYSVNSKLYGQIGVPLNIVIGTDDVGGVFLKRTDNQFLNKNQNGNIISAVTGYEFNIIAVPNNDNNKIILGRYVTVNNVKKIDKVLVIKDNNLKVINFNDISTEEVYNSMILTYYTSEQISKVPCTTNQVVAYNCSDKTVLSGIENRRGREVRRVNVTYKGIGDEQCNVDVNGVEFSLLDYANNPNISRESDTQYLVATNCDIDCDYEINDTVAKPQCISRDCYKTIDGDSVKKLNPGAGYTTLQGYNADGTPKVCPGTTQRVDCVDQGWLRECDPCDPKLDVQICDKVTTSSPVQRYIKSYKAVTDGTKCETTLSDKVNEWNQDAARKYETTPNCDPSCTSKNWKSTTKCAGTTKITTWEDVATQRSGYPSCDGPSSPGDSSVNQGCTRCSSKSVKNQTSKISDDQRNACDNLEGCSGRSSSTTDRGGNVYWSYNCSGDYGY